jgi:hypothetical protein
MKTVGVFIFSLCAFGLMAQQSIGIVSSDPKPLKDYRLPDWGYSRASMGMSFSSSGLSMKNDDDEYDNNNASLSITPIYRLFKESESNTTDVNVSGQAIVRQSKTTIEDNFSRETFRNPRQDLRLDGNGTWKNYFPTHFYEGTSSALFIQNHSEQKSNVRAFIPPSSSKTSSELTESLLLTRASVGIGVGRVRNVTPVIRALRLRERLRAVNQEASGDLVEKAAVEFTRYPGYVSTYDRPQKHFWNALQDDVGNKSLFESQYLNDVFSEALGERLEGYEFGARLQGSFFDYHFKSKSSGLFGDDEESDNFNGFLLGPQVAARIFTNYSLRGQFGIIATLSYDVALNEEDNPIKNLLATNARIEHLYSVMDRLLWQTSLTLDYLEVDPRGFGVQATSQRLGATSSLILFIEDRLNLSGNFLWYKTTNDPESSLAGFNPLNNITYFNSLASLPLTFEKQTNWQISIGLNYYLDRNLR